MLDRPQPAELDRLRAAPIDPLGEALHFLRMSGIFYVRSELRAPWGIALPPMRDFLSFHVVTEGQCLLQLDDGSSKLLRPRELALVPHGAGHRLKSDAGADPSPLFDIPHDHISERYAILRHGGEGAACTLICGTVRFDHPAARSLIKLLPASIVVDGARSELDWMHDLLRLMASEARVLRPGGEEVITRLADILVIQAIRSWIEEGRGEELGWLRALKDQKIGRALSLIHREPERAWTVASLAKEVAMSRSAFAARFTELAGEPAMSYLARWRMNVAASRLEEGEATVSEVANGLGYESEAAFSRAFKKILGVSPGAARRKRSGTKPAFAHDV